jgi:hypothetical protein
MHTEFEWKKLEEREKRPSLISADNIRTDLR